MGYGLLGILILLNKLSGMLLGDTVRNLIDGLYILHIIFCIYIYVYIYVCVCIFMFMYTYVCVYVCIYLCIYVYIFMYVDIDIFLFYIAMYNA